MASRRPALLMLAAMSGGCTLGPDSKNPTAPGADRHVAEDQPTSPAAVGVPGGERRRIVQGMDIPGQRWAVFHSQPLNELIRNALAANPDIRAADASLRAAQAAARAQRATLFPTLQAGAAAARSQGSNVLPAPTASGDFVDSLFTLGLTVSYTLDFFGANRRAIGSAEAQAQRETLGILRRQEGLGAITGADVAGAR